MPQVPTSGELLSTNETYDLILTEGDLRKIVARLEELRQQTDQAHCLCLHIEPGPQGTVLHRHTIQPLAREIIREIRMKEEMEF